LTARLGNIDTFNPFFELADIWYLVDGSCDIVLMPIATTLVAISPKALDDAQHSESMKQFVKRSTQVHYLAPWDLYELYDCRDNVFLTVPNDVLEYVFSKAGEV
jgi:hypothetical protein